MRERRGGGEALRDEAGENCGGVERTNWYMRYMRGACARSSGLPAWPPRPRPHFVLAKPIIAARERQLDEIRRSRMNIGILRGISYTPLA
jgi:hypothetical protein